MKIAVYGIRFSDASVAFVQGMVDALVEKQADIMVYKPFLPYLSERVKLPAGTPGYSGYSDLKGKADFLFSLGGDGTLLETVTQIRDSGIPILGINTGRLGFLSGIAKEDIGHSLNELFAGRFYLDKRALLRLESEAGLFGDLNFALNEVTVHKKDSSSMITIHTYIDDAFLNSFWADGLIIATPTGSTGYSLSCGGPIIQPRTENFVITPIAPHNLNVRPIVISDNLRIRLRVEGRGESSFLTTLDSRSVTIETSLEMTICREDFSVTLVRLQEESFLSTLRNKLMWGVDKRN